MRLMVSRKLPLRRTARVIGYSIPILPLPLLLQGAIPLPANELLRFPIQHEVRRSPVLKVPAERDVLVASPFKKPHFLVLGAVDGVELPAGETETGRCYGIEVIEDRELDLGREICDIWPGGVFCEQRDLSDKFVD